MRPETQGVSTEQRNDLIALLWDALGGEADLAAGVRLTGPDQVLPSVYDVTGFAAATVGVASLAAAELHSVRTGEAMRTVGVDRRNASAAFLSELLFSPHGWERPPIWDPIAGDYLASDGWIKLHTNYRHHRLAVEKTLGTVQDRDSIASAVQRWSAQELQDAIVDSGGCAAAMNERERWLKTPAGIATANEPIAQIDYQAAAGAQLARLSQADGPLSGIRILDLTRVIAGPVCTRFLVGYGADVLRIDPRVFEEVGALVPETSAGKRCSMLDLATPADRAIFQTLLGQAHVLVTGLRPGALEALGYDDAQLRSLNPDLIVGRLDAYGWSGPWAGRRGFDSLVQMSCGIAAAGSLAKGSERPAPLPAQALDHGTGYVLAAAICRALLRQVTEGSRADIRCSLISTANVLTGCPTPLEFDGPAPEWSEGDTEWTQTFWGPARRVPIPGRIEGLQPWLPIEPGPLGRHEPAWSTR